MVIMNDPDLTGRARKKGKSFIEEFKQFLEKYKVIGMAIAFTMGAASKDFVQDVVEGVVMPVITFFIPGGQWETSTLNIGPIVIQWGRVLSGAISFLIMAIVIFVAVKYVIGEDKTKK